MTPHLVTLFNDDYEVGFVCAAVNALYGEKHGLPVRPLVLSRAEMDVLCEGRHFAWAKVALMRWIFAVGEDTTLAESGAAKVLAAHIDSSARSDLAAAGWIIWVDADLMVVDHGRDVRSFLRGDKDLVLGEDMADLDWLNTGLVACQTRSHWARGMWARVWREGDTAFHQDEFWDQSAICGCLAKWGEGGFLPSVVGGKPTGVAAPERPWFSWQGGLRHKETQHLLVLNAGSWQINNPRYAQFAFHAAGMKDKARSCRFLIEASALRGFAATPGVVDSVKARCLSAGASAEMWESGFRSLQEAAAAPPRACPWGWPEVREMRWQNERRIPLAASASAKWDGTSPALLEAPAPPPWSLSRLAAACGEALTKAVAHSPARPSDPPPALPPFAPAIRARLWEMVDYALGYPPSVHTALRQVDPSRQWRTDWRPWEDARPGQQPAAPALPPPPAALLRLLPGGAAPADARVEVAPPGAVLRTHQPAGGAGWLLWQMEGEQQVALLPPDSSRAVALAGAAAPLAGLSQSEYSPWENASAGAWTALLRGGQALAVPRGWWLSARALTASLSVAFALGGPAPAPAVFEPAVEAASQAAAFGATLGERPLAMRVVRPGTGPPVPKVKRLNAVCHYELYGCGRFVRSSRSRGPEALNLGVDPNLGRLDEAVRGLRVGDRALVAVAGPPGAGGALVFDLELLAVKLPAAPGSSSSVEDYNSRWMTWFDPPDKWRPLWDSHSSTQCHLRQKATPVAAARNRRSAPVLCRSLGRRRKDWPVRRPLPRPVD